METYHRFISSSLSRSLFLESQGMAHEDSSSASLLYFFEDYPLLLYPFSLIHMLVAFIYLGMKGRRIEQLLMMDHLRWRY